VLHTWQCCRQRLLQTYIFGRLDAFHALRPSIWTYVGRCPQSAAVVDICMPFPLGEISPCEVKCPRIFHGPEEISTGVDMHIQQDICIAHLTMDARVI
jgi:hypothetical protein